MQNKSYERYVDLLRAAEVQQYDRTSARFVAAVGTAGAGSLLARNPLATFISALTSIGLIVLAVFSLRPAADDTASVRSVDHSAISSPATHDAGSLQLAPSEAQEDVVHGQQLASEDLERDPVSPAVASEFIADEIVGISTVEAKPDHIDFGVRRDLPLTHVQSLYVQEDSENQSWSLSLSSIDPGLMDQISLRIAALTEIGSGVSIGLAGGIVRRNFERSNFAGFKDTFFVIEGREMSSKIGFFTNSESSLSYLEAGVAAQYRPMNLLQSARFVPAFMLFGGVEGQTIVIEQSLAIDWLLTSRMSAFVGISLREYLASERAMQVTPVLGFRAGF